jgi:hypothetical protein
MDLVPLTTPFLKAVVKGCKNTMPMGYEIALGWQ